MRERIISFWAYVWWIRPVDRPATAVRSGAGLPSGASPLCSSARESETSLARSIRRPAPPERGWPARLRGLLADEPRRQDRARGPGPQTEREPEQPPHAEAFLPPLAAESTRRLADPDPDRDELDQGPGDGLLDEPRDPPDRPTISRSPRARRRRDRARGSCAPETPSPRAAAGPSPRASRRSGSSCSRTRNVLMRTTHRNRTREPPERGEHDEGDVTTVERCDHAHVAALLPSFPPVSRPGCVARTRRRAPGPRIIPGCLLHRPPERLGRAAVGRLGLLPLPDACSTGSRRTARAGTPGRPGGQGSRAGTCSPCRIRVSSSPGGRVPLRWSGTGSDEAASCCARPSAAITLLDFAARAR